MAELIFQRTNPIAVATTYPRLVKLASTPGGLIANAHTVRHLVAEQGSEAHVEIAVQVATVLVRDFGGRLPATKEALLELPGVGDYFASAVMCFGYGRQTVLMDANTERVASRVMGRNGSGRRWQKRLDLYKLAGAHGADRAFNQAVLDLGAVVCLAPAPRCAVCPVSAHCASSTKHPNASRK